MPFESTRFGHGFMFVSLRNTSKVVQFGAKFNETTLLDGPLHLDSTTLLLMSRSTCFKCSDATDFVLQFVWGTYPAEIPFIETVPHLFPVSVFGCVDACWSLWLRDVFKRCVFLIRGFVFFTLRLYCRNDHASFPPGRVSMYWKDVRSHNWRYSSGWHSNLNYSPPLEEKCAVIREDGLFKMR